VKTLKSFNAAIATSALALATMGAVNATTIGTVASPSHPSAATFTGGSAGTLTVSNVPITFDGASAVLTFSPLSVVPPPAAIESLTGGTFTITSGANTLLAGGFTSSGLVASSGSQTVSFLSNNVTYTGGSKLALAGLTAGDSGSFSLSFADSVHNPAKPALGVAIDGAGYIESFSTDGVGGTFSGTHTVGNPGGPGNPVPEPGSVAVLMIGGMFLLGAALRRRTGASTFAA